MNTKGVSAFVCLFFFCACFFATIGLCLSPGEDCTLEIGGTIYVQRTDIYTGGFRSTLTPVDLSKVYGTCYPKSWACEQLQCSCYINKLSQ